MQNIIKEGPILKRSSLKEMDFLHDIKSIEEEYITNYGHAPLNVSDWNPSDEFKEKMLHLSVMKNNFNSIEYVFSYTFNQESHNDILKKLGYNNNSGERAVLITPNGSTSIRNVLHWLKENHFNRLLAISPTYFTVFYGCRDYNIECKEIFLNRNKDSFFINENELFNEIKHADAIWLTSPVYCTSTYFDSTMINYFIKVLNMGKVIVADESLCMSGHELIRKLGKYKNFIGIYSPHKSVCVNGNKFSIITFAKEEKLLFNDWVVALSGNLLVSNGIAVNHFLSNDFNVYNQAFTYEINLNFIKLKDLLNQLNVDYDHKSEGYLVTLYFPNISGKKGYDKTFLKELIFKTGTTMIPGIRNHFSGDLGFCFRVNLCCLTDCMVHSLIRLISYLQQF